MTSKQDELLQELHTTLGKHVKKRVDVQDTIHTILKFSALAIRHFIREHSTDTEGDKKAITKEFERLINSYKMFA